MNKKIGLALSGGGALGAAHVGVLEEIEKNQIKVDVIAGTSVGAMTGALFADGGIKSVHDFFKLIEKKEIFSRKNILLSHSTNKIFSQIREVLGIVLKSEEFKDLKIRFYCLATELETGKPKVFSKGNLIDAIMASSAYPGLFPVQKVDDVLYIDGGIVENMPVGVLKNLSRIDSKEKDAGFIIGSSLVHLTDLTFKETDSISSKIKVVQRAIEIMESELAKSQIENCDFCFQMPLNKYSWYNFMKIKEIQKAGKKYAKNEIGKLIKELK
jgi:NTE family protein